MAEHEISIKYNEDNARTLKQGSDGVILSEEEINSGHARVCRYTFGEVRRVLTPEHYMWGYDRWDCAAYFNKYEFRMVRLGFTHGTNEPDEDGYRMLSGKIYDFLIASKTEEAKLNKFQLSFGVYHSPVSGIDNLHTAIGISPLKDTGAKNLLGMQIIIIVGLAIEKLYSKIANQNDMVTNWV